MVVSTVGGGAVINDAANNDSDILFIGVPVFILFSPSAVSILLALRKEGKKE